MRRILKYDRRLLSKQETNVLQSRKNNIHKNTATEEKMVLRENDKMFSLTTEQGARCTWTHIEEEQCLEKWIRGNYKVFL